MLQIFVEGGGLSQLDRELRKAFTTLLQRVSPDCEFSLRMGGSRSETLRDYRIARTAAAGAHDVWALIDAEEPVNGRAKLDFLRQTGWPSATQDEADGVFLMVESFESWLVCDPSGWETHFNGGFARTSLPVANPIDGTPKKDVMASISRAVKNTRKAKYSKGRDPQAILLRSDPAAMQARSESAKAFLDALRRYCKDH